MVDEKLELLKKAEDLKEDIKSRGITRNQIAFLLGMSITTIYNYLSSPSEESLSKIARAADEIEKIKKEK